MTSIRLVLLTLVCLVVPSLNLADDRPAATAASSKLAYRGFAIDIAALADVPDPEPIIAALKTQIDMVVDTKVNPQVAEFFLNVPVTLGSVADEHLGVFRDRTVLLTAEPIPINRGVLIHELIHAYHKVQMRDDQKRQVAHYHREAIRAYGLSSSEYFLTNESEFFAITASIYLRGKSSRLPHTRQILQAVQPDYYRFLGAMFDPEPTGTPRPPTPRP